MRSFSVKDVRGQEVYEWERPSPPVMPKWVQIVGSIVVAFLVGMLMAGGM